MRRTRLPQPCCQARMQGLQPIHRAVLDPGSGPSCRSCCKENGNYRRDRSYSRPARRGRAALLQRKTLQAHRPRPAAASSVGFAARFAYEHRYEVPRSRGCFPHAPAGQLARTEERSPHADEYAFEIQCLGAARGSCGFSRGKGKEGVGLPSARLSLWGTLRRTCDGGHEHSLSNPIIDVAPADTIAPERQQPDHERRCIPNDDEWHFFPESLLPHSPRAHQPRHRHAEPHVGADIPEADYSWMSQRDSYAPWQSLGKSKPRMSPRPHVPHHCHPTKPLAEKRAGRIKVWHCLHRVREQLDLNSLLRDQTANQQIIGGLVFNRFVSAESSKARTGCNNGRSQGELNSIQLPGNQNSRVEIGIHADGLKMLRECFVLGGNVQAGHSSHFRITQRRHHGAQIIWLHANVAVINH